jgi:hypothetical protein
MMEVVPGQCLATGVTDPPTARARANGMEKEKR